MPEVHLKYRPSAAPRWMKCPGSLNCPQDTELTETAVEGLAAHKLAHRCWLLGTSPPEFIGQDIDGIEVTDEMADGVQLYVDQIETAANELNARRDQIHLEYFVRSDVLADFGGTIDCLIRTDAGLAIIDFRYGYLSSDVATDRQLLCYAILTRELNQAVSLTIVQPRAPHTDGPIRSCTVGPNQLNEFAVKCFAAIARGPEEVFVAGDHCRYCPRKANCPELYQLTLDAAESGFDEKSMTPDRAAAVLNHKSAVEGYLQAIEQYAQGQLQEGEEIPGFKLVPRFGKRRYCVDEDTVLRRCRSRRFGKKRVCRKQLLSPAQLEKVVGPDLVDSLVERPQVGTAVVPACDHRRPVATDEPVQEYAQ